MSEAAWQCAALPDCTTDLMNDHEGEDRVWGRTATGFVLVCCESAPCAREEFCKVPASVNTLRSVCVEGEILARAAS